MPVIAVCSLAMVNSTVARLKPWGLVTLLDPHTMIETPEGVRPQTHLKVGVNDIGAAAVGLISPGNGHVTSILRHARAWDTRAPLVVHCWAGVSRSTATAFITACLLNPDVSESTIANTIRDRSPTATPNRLLTSIADDMLDRGGRMVDAVDAIGRGEECWEGVPFELPAVWPATR
jgi:predicted protein tyrosine phosphatase